MNKKYSGLYLIILLGFALFSALAVSWQMAFTANTQDQLSVLSLGSIRHGAVLKLLNRRRKAPVREAKGLYLTAYSAGNKAKADAIIDLINNTELNSIVIDIKDYSGLVLYDSEVGLVNELKTEDNRLGNVRSLIKKLHDNDIYAIARQTVFQDPILAERKSEWA
ncbi:MAG: putative glycoside hydrolase, partial [Patescibacteria group bacterium]